MADPIPQVFIGPQNPSDAGVGWGWSTYPASPEPYVGYTGADVAALLSQPPGASTNPVTGEVTFPTGPGGGGEPPPPTAAASPSDWSGFFFGIGSGIWGRRRYVPGKLERAIEHGIKTGLQSIFRSVSSRFPQAGTPTQESDSGWSRVFTRKGEPAPRVVIGPPGEPPTGGSWYGRAFGMFAGLASNPFVVGMLALMYPRATASNDTTYQDIGMGQRDAEELGRYYGQLAIREAQDRMLENSRLQQAVQSGGLPAGNEVRFGPQDYGRPVDRRALLLQGVEDYLPQALQDAMRALRRGEVPARPPSARQGGAIVPPKQTGTVEDLSIGPPAPSVSGSSSSSSSTGKISGPGRLPHPNVRWGKIGIGAGAIVAANYFLPRVFGSSPSSQFVIPVAPITNNNPVSSTTPEPGTFYASGFSGGGGYCVPRPRGPRRKCLERAPVSWRSGSRKGKSAGTKCLRYASRKS